MLRNATVLLFLALFLFSCDEESQDVEGGSTCSNDTDCSSGMVCQRGICQQESESECTDNDVDCDGSWVRVCQYGRWIRNMDCANLDKVCQNGSCQNQDVECEDNDVDCDGTWVRVCQHGEWLRNMDCANLDKQCKNGQCIDPMIDEDGDLEEEDPTDGDEELISCTDEPCCQNGQWMADTSTCSTGNSIPACTEERCTSNHECRPVVLENYCLMDNECYMDGQSHPENPCQACNATLNAWAAIDEGNVCNDDGNACNGVYTCHEGDCMISTPEVTCQASDECHLVGVCDARTGLCSDPFQADGTLCGSSDQCYQGVCVDCLNNAGCLDLADDGLECTGAVCDLANHLCEHDPSAHVGQSCGDSTDSECDHPDTCDAHGVCQPNYADSTTLCNDDGNACNGVYTCNQGLCDQSTDPVTCIAPEVCKLDGVCDPATGVCFYANQADGIDCGEDDFCYQGSCVECIEDSQCTNLPDDGLECTSPACDLDTHTCVHDGSKHIGERCGDDTENDCNQPDTCDANGICQSNHEPSTTSCMDENSCLEGGSCDGLGMCVDGTVCNGHGTCSESLCSCSSDYNGDSCEFWTKDFGTSVYEIANDTAMDSQGNVYLTGYFKSTISFGNTTLPCNGSSDAYLTKLGPDGIPLWAKRLGGANNDVGMGIAVDTEDNVIFTGYFEGNIIMNGEVVTSRGNSDIFVFKYNADGEYIWGKTFGSADSSAGGNGIALDSQNDLLLTGYFGGTIDFGGDETRVSNGDKDIFLLKLTADGETSWAWSAGGASEDSSNAVAVDAQDNIAITGYFSDTATFGDENLTSAGGTDIFISKFDGDGSNLWNENYDGGSTSHYDVNDYGRSCAFDSVGHVLVTGDSPGYPRLFLYSSDGSSLIWHKSFSDYGETQAVARKVLVDSQDRILITINCYDTNIGDGHTSYGGGVLARFLLDGTFDWLKHYGFSSQVFPMSMVWDKDENIVWTGRYIANTLTINEISISNEGDSDIFIAHLPIGN